MAEEDASRNVEYETAASGTTQQYKGKNVIVLEVEGCRSSVVGALVGSNPLRQLTCCFFPHFFFAFFFRPL